MMHALRKCLFFYLLTCLGLHALGSEIIHGEPVPEKMMPYMASLQDQFGYHICGGFLISEDYVLTAAHCAHVSKRCLTSVVLGTHDLRKVDDATMRYGVKICEHPSYKDFTTGDDIMLLKLSRKAQMSERLQKILLADPESKLKDNTLCRVAGWGAIVTNGGYVDKLLKVKVNVVNTNTCKEQWKMINFELPAKVICAGGYQTKEGFCQGDSGGPLVCGGKAVGVVSFNCHCDYPQKPQVPNVYTDLSKYRSWIDKTIKQNSCKM
ncbi:granzyme B-like isoform X1 [Xyrichtys novacula]|uniref:trypsin n=1 Tax=Xyrichtys novacula TaxID=13765 RepID=A0AAV1FFU8_XYRNO|nr:granzyme B-like isoform X1 [Xyrichtys novacula]